MRRRRKRKKPVWIIPIVVLFVVVLVVVAFFMFKKGNKGPDPSEVFNQYMSYTSKAEYGEMYEMLTQESRSTISKEEFVTRYENIYGGMEVSDYQGIIKDIEDNEASVLIHYDVTMDTIAGNLTFSNEAILYLKEEDKEKNYLINWDSQDILPNLKTGDKVKIETTKAERGNIYDRNQNPLALQGYASSVGIVPGKLSENRSEDLQKISELLGVSVESIEKSLSASYVKEDTFVPIRVVAKDDEELKENLLQISGIMITDKEVRYYPLKEAAAHITGYVQSITAEELEAHQGEYYNANSVIGKAGLELLYEERLRAVDGCEILIVDEEGNVKDTVLSRLPQNGENITVTIDITMQNLLYGQLEEDAGYSVAMNPKTGEIIGMVSSPSYDPNEFVRGLTTAKWNELSERADQPLYNRIRGTWSPGSSFKPVIAAIGLSTDILHESDVMEYTGTSWQKDAGWGNYYVTTLKEYSVKNLRNALVYSDNIFFARTALNIGAETLSKELDKIGFGEELPFAFTLNKSQYGAEGIIDDEIQLADTGYGQGEVLVNPIHMASVYSAFVNEGNMVEPYLEYESGKEIKYLKENVFTPGAAAVVFEDMVQVIEDEGGTGAQAKIDGLKLAGKTGTAEIKNSKDDTTGTELGWFIAMNDDNESDSLLILSMIEDVKDRGGSHYVIPKVKAVFEAY